MNDKTYKVHNIAEKIEGAHKTYRFIALQVSILISNFCIVIPTQEGSALRIFTLPTYCGNYNYQSSDASFLSMTKAGTKLRILSSRRMRDLLLKIQSFQINYSYFKLSISRCFLRQHDKGKKSLCQLSLCQIKLAQLQLAQLVCQYYFEKRKWHK